MEALKNYVRGEISFDNRHDLEARGFERALQEAIDTCLIYYSDCKAFYELNPTKVFELSQENGWELDTSKDPLDQITDMAREAFTCLIYNHMYSELEEAYKEAQRISEEDFLENDFDTNFDLLTDNGLNDYYTEEDMKDLIKSEVDNDNFFMVKHLVEAYDYEAKAYLYDRSMGTLETPTPLKTNDDLLEVAKDLGLIKEGE